jgi:CheY-like chemotaxis protein
MTPDGQESAVTPRHFDEFNRKELDKLIQGSCKVFRLKTGDLLLLSSLVCVAREGERNRHANCLLRSAINDPGGEVCGSALLLGHEEFRILSQAAQATWLLEVVAKAPIVLVLDRNEGFRAIMAERLEHDRFLVVQARTVIEATEFCKSHPIDLLVADVSSLRPTPIETLLFIRQAQSQVKVLLISGYDISTVESVYPGLLTGTEFLQKPFSLNVMANVAHCAAGSNGIDPLPQPSAHSPAHSEG